jgi:hypothetical protein
VSTASSAHIDKQERGEVEMERRWVVDDRLDTIYARAAERLGDRAPSHR